MSDPTPEKTKELKSKLTKQEQYERNIKRGKDLLKEIQTEREKIGALFFAGSVVSGDIDITNIDELLTRNLTKDKDRKIYRDYFDQIAEDLARKNQKKLKVDEPVDEPVIIDQTAEYQTPDYRNMYKALREADHARN